MTLALISSDPCSTTLKLKQLTTQDKNKVSKLHKLQTFLSVQYVSHMTNKDIIFGRQGSSRTLKTLLDAKSLARC